MPCARIPGGRAPLLWVVPPFLGGILLSFHLGWSGRAACWAALGGALLAAAADAWRALRAARGRGRPDWLPWGSAIAAGALGAAWMAWELSPPPGWEGLPPREAVLELQLERVLPNRAGGPPALGLARVVAAPLHLACLKGRRVALTADRARQGPVWRVGAQIRAVGVLERLPPGEGRSRFEAWAIRTGATLALRRARTAETREPPLWRRAAESTAAAMEAQLRRGAGGGGSSADTLVAMVLGRAGALDPERRDAFQRTGTLHLFAISGMNIGLVALSLSVLLGWLPLPRAPAQVAGLVLVGAFVAATGLGASALRALLMLAGAQAGGWIGRASGVTSGLLASAGIVAVIDPSDVLSPGFQLSYGVVAALVWMGGPLAERWACQPLYLEATPPADRSRWRRGGVAAWDAATGACAVGASALLASTPLTLLYFNWFTPGGLLANLAMVPLASLATISGCASLACGAVGLGGLGSLYNRAGYILVEAMEACARAAADWPGMAYSGEWCHDAVGGLVIVLVLASCAWGAARRWQPGWMLLLPPVLLGLGLLCGAHWDC